LNILKTYNMSISHQRLHIASKTSNHIMMRNIYSTQS
jgi:hypothetical protein